MTDTSREALIAILRSKYRDTKQMLPIDYCHAAADMLEADARDLETLSRSLEDKKHDCEFREAQQVAVAVRKPLTNKQKMTLATECGIAGSIGMLEAFELGVSHAERYHNIGAKP